jgi:Leucine-rich repeat (LRR) protein
VNIPDVNFKAYLVGNAAINTNADTEIQVSEASAYVGTMNCSNLTISDLTGIEAFTQLTYLDCKANSLTAIPLFVEKQIIT